MSVGMAPAPWSAALGLLAPAGRRPLAALAALGAAQAVLPLAGLVALQHLLDAVAAGLAGTLEPARALTAVGAATAAAAAVALLTSLVQSGVALTSEACGRTLADATVQRVQEHAAALDLGDFDQPQVHDLLQRAGAEAASRPVRLLQDGLALLVAAVGMLAMAGWLLRVEPWLPLLVAAAAVPTAFARRRHADQRLAWQQANVGAQREVGYLGAVLTGRASAADVRLLGAAGFFAARLAALRGRLRDSLAALARRREGTEIAVATLRSVGLFAAWYVLAQRALAGELSLGGLVLHAQAAQRTQHAVRDLLGALAVLREHRRFLRPVVDLLGRRPTVVGTPPLATPPPGPPRLSAAGVAFRYPETARDALSDLTFEIAAGERVAIVGANGSGKSTLLRLLARLYDPTAGAITAQGIDLRRVDPVAWRARIAALPQDGSLYELSVRENLALGLPHAPSARALEQVLAAVGLVDTVAALPNGLDTVCSRRVPGGVDWSHGQAQRLLLARVLLRPADLVLLDEPFAGLDAASAARLVDYLQQLPRATTWVLAEHRLEYLRLCDRVLVLHAGRLVRAGSAAALQDPDLLGADGSGT
jgi:ATP-binding cassette subfamily B protein